MFTGLKKKLARGAVPLDADALVEEATRRAGRSDLGAADGHLAGLRALCAAADEDELLHTRGRAELKATLVLALEQRLELVSAREAAPPPPSRPLFIAGLPRTGTTLLHRLLSLAPGARYLPLWLCMRPLPPPDDEEWRGDADPHGRRKTAHALVEASRARDPELAAIHAMEADGPEECTHLFRPTFSTWQYFITTPLPSYARWFLDGDQRAPYAFFRDTLGVLGRHLGGDHWVLKAPQHWGCLPELLATFPDADVVCTHRDPARVVGSWCSLLHHLWRQKSDRVTPADVGRSQLDVLATSTERALVAREDGDARIVDVTFDALVADPLATARRVLEQLGRPLDPAHDEAMERFLVDNPRDKHGRHRYAASDFGVTDADLAGRFAGYRDVISRLRE